MITNEQIIEAMVELLADGNIHPTEALEDCFGMEKLTVERWNEFKEHIQKLYDARTI